MRAGSRHAVSFIFAALFFCALVQPARAAADMKAEMQWFVHLVMVNNGKTFCVPPAVTLKDMVAAFAKFSRSHPEFHDSLSDQQVIGGLAESYPCKAIVADPLKMGADQVDAVPKGEFATIDTRATNAIMQMLHGTSANENNALVDQIVKNSGSYMPPVLFALADLFYRQGDFDDAIFWFNAARLRAAYDAALNTDATAAAAISTLAQQLPRELIKKEFDDLDKLGAIIGRVLKWDETTPYNYDHRWISLYGMRAINSRLGNKDGAAPLTVPRQNWDALAQKNRDQYRHSLDEAVEIVKKQRTSPKSNVNTP